MRFLRIAAFALFVLLSVVPFTATAAENRCDLYPIALPLTEIGSVAEGSEQTLDSKVGGGHFSWLSWDGDIRPNILAAALTPPGTQAAYQNPNDSNDSQLDPGDWVYGLPGVKSAGSVRTSLDGLIGREIVVPVWRSFYAKGKQRTYLADSFAKIKLRAYQLNGNGSLTFQFLGMANCYNTPPVVEDIVITTEEDSAVAFRLEASDAEGDDLVYSITAQPERGVISGTAPDLTYTPNPDFNGSDSLSFTVSDGEFVVEASVTIAVTAVNDLPVIEVTALQTAEDQAISGTLHATDVDGDELTYSATFLSEHGQLTLAGNQFTYTPTENYYGTDHFIIEVSDGQASVTGQYDIVIEAVNDTPVIVSQSIHTAEDQSVSGFIQASDIDGDTLVYAIQTAPSLGQVSLTGNQYDYTPAENQNGSDHFVVTVSDGQVTVTAEYGVAIDPVNDAPVVTVEAVTVDEDQPIVVTINATDVDGDILAYSLTEPATKGTVALNDAQFTYSPNANKNGQDAFTISVSDGTSAVEATYTVTINPVNDAPAAQGQNLTTNEDTTVSITLGGSDIDGDSLTYTVTAQPAHGVLSGAASNLVYTPNPDFSGEDRFQFIASDGELDSAEATVSLNILAVNDAPVIAVEPVTLQEDQPVSFAIQATDPDGDALSYSLVSETVLGTASLTGNVVTFTPAPNANGIELLQVAVTDGSETVTVTYTLTIEGQNDVPVATGQNVSTDEDRAVTIVLTAQDVDGDSLTYQITQQPSYGVIAGEGQTVSYTPNANFYGQDSFAFVANDGTVSSNEATVSISINNINDRPVAVSSSVAGDEDTIISGQIEASDVDDDALTYSIATTPANGQVELSGNQYSYTPTANYNGNDQFIVRVSDGQSSVLATVSVTVLAVNDAPVAQDYSVEVEQGSSIVISLFGSDVDGDALSYALSSQPQNGEAEISGNQLTYVAHTAGQDRFAYTVEDAAGLSSAGTILVNVLSTNTAPSITSLPVKVGFEGVQYTYTMSAEDAEGGLLSYELVSAPEGVQIDELSGVVGWENPVVGVYSVEVLVRDEGGASDRQEFELVILERPDAKVVGGTEYWFMFNKNYTNSHYLYLSIGATNETAFELSIPGLGYHESNLVGNNTAVLVDLSEYKDQLASDETGVIENAVHLKSDLPVSVVLYNLTGSSSDSTLILPTEALGRNYQLATYEGGWGGALYGVVATEDGTHVTVSNAEGIVQADFDLSSGQAYQYLTGDEENISRYEVSSTKPVSVFAGSKCTSVYRPACDHLIEQMLPSQNLASEYYYAPSANRFKGDTVRVYAGYDDTVVRVNGAISAYLNKGEYYNSIINEPSFIQTSKPSTVVQYANGSNYDYELLGGFIGDPYSQVLYPKEYFAKTYNLFVPDVWYSGNIKNYDITLWSETENIENVYANGEQVPVNVWKQLEGTSVSFAQFEVEIGVNTFSSSGSPIGLQSYYFGHFESYSNWGGVATSRFLEVEGLRVRQSHTERKLGEEICLDVTAFASAYKPVSGASVSLNVANPYWNYNVSDNADEFGRVHYCYTSAHAGKDTVTITSGNQSETVEITWMTGDNGVNDDPIIESLPVISGIEQGSVYSYQLVANDPDGDSLTYSLASAPTDMAIDSVTGLVTWPVPETINQNYVEIKVEDGNGGVAVQKFNVATVLVNRPPVILVEPENTTVKAGYTFSYDLIFDDPDSNQSHYAEIVEGPSTASVVNSQYVNAVYWTPENSDAEQYHHFVVRLVDQYGAYDEREFDVYVEYNEPPVFTNTTPPTKAIVDHTYYYWPSYSDPDGDIVTATLVKGPEGMVRQTSGRLIWTPTEEQLGVHEVVIQIEDYASNIVTLSYEVTVVPNNAPVILSSDKLSSAVSGHRYRSYFKVSDPDGDNVRYRLLDAPEGMSISTLSINWTPGDDQAGEHNVTWEAYDNYGASITESFTVTVARNQAPVLTNQPGLTAATSHLYTFKPSLVDPDGDAAKFKLVSAPSGFGLASGTEYRWIPADSQVGEHQVVIDAYDDFGGVNRISYSITVHQDKAPVLTNAPLARIPAGEYYSYTATATDPESDTIRYSLQSGPAGMTFTYPYNFWWTPTLDQVGNHDLTIRLADVHGNYQDYDFVITVFDPSQPVNTPPTITSDPVQYGRVGQQYTYDIEATDAEGDTLTYALTTAPAGMSIDSATGLISWMPETAETVMVEFTVTDSFGAGVGEYYELRVVDADKHLSGSISVAPQYVDPSETVQFRVQPEDSTGAVTIEASVDGETVTLDETNLGSYSSDAIGEHIISATITDALDTITVTESFIVRDPSDTTDPVVELITPEDHQNVTEPLDVVGTVEDANLVNWTLSYQRQTGRNTDVVVLAEGTSNQSNAVLGTFDPTLLKNGQYLIMLSGTDQNGVTITHARIVMVTGNLKVGNFSFTIEDLNIPMSGIPMSVSRTYDTRQKTEQTDLGYGWTFDYQNVEVHESRNPASQWAQNEYHTGPLGTLINYCIEPLGAPVVSVTLPNGDVERFDVRASNSCTLTGGHEVEFDFQPQSGTLSTLTQSQYANLRLVGDQLVDAAQGGIVADPRYYTLTTQAGFVYALDENLGVKTITDPNGNTITYNDNGIFHSDGKAITFTRDETGRVTTVTDPAGNAITYVYDDAGDLVESVDQSNAKTTFTYYTGNHVHVMAQMHDPLGRKLVKNIYDDSGRLIAQEDSEGNRTEFNHDLAGKLSVVTDRLGRITQHFYDDRGNILNTVDASGKTTQYTYDADDNQLTVTNALNETTTATYDDRRNQLTQTDALGNTVAFEYNLRGQETKITDARGNAFENVYDSFGNLLQVTDPQNNTTGQTINEKGLVSSRTDAKGNITRFEYDSEGNVTTETAADGSVTTYTYDANNNKLTESRTRTVDGQTVSETTAYEYDAQNRVVQVTDTLGNVTKTEFDLMGNEVAREDAKGRRTEMSYDLYGRLLSITYPDGTTANKTYDAEGNLLTETDRLGRTTQYEYDALNRVVKTIYADGSSTRTEYDDAGRVVAEVDGNDNRTEHEYDAAGRRIQTTDALGNVYRFEYDADGNLLKEIDPKQQETVHTYDSLDRRTRTTFADNNIKQSVYDTLERITGEIDEAGVRTEFAYDELGRLTLVKQGVDVTGVTTATEVGATTEYTYDEAGNKLTQTDAEGRVTSWTYDALGRALTRQLPMGQTEGFSYDASGNIASYTDFNGQVTTYTYDNNDRLTQKTYDDGTTESWTYDAVGNVLTATQSTGGTTTYTYDNRDRLLTETKPDGSVLSYSYDNVGNKLSFTLTPAGQSSGITTTYTYDALNRLKTVTDHNDHVTTYRYDANGNRASVSHSNGLSTEYSYDARNRLTQISHKDAQGNVLKQYGYTLHATGRREQISENTGRITDYSYDSLYRLTKEVITDAVNGNHSSEYSYDKVGNRTQSIINGVTTAYSYDNNDRLTQSGGTRYEYDANGNTTQVTLDSDVTTYTYNAKNKLTAASITEGGITKSMAYTYDIDGNRITSTVDGTTTAFLVDNNQDYAQVVQESQNGSPSVTYTFGDDLISQDRSGQSSFYHYDGLGSTRALSDSTGNVTDSYDYEAFGELLNSAGSTENSYLYTGEQYDEGLGDYYLRARYYDQGIGRFTQMDAFAGFSQKPQSLNKFVYADSDPVNGVDPSGNFTLGQATATIRNIGNLAGRSIANVGRSAMRSFNNMFKKFAQRAKNSISKKKKVKKGRKDNEEANDLSEALVMAEALLGAGYYIQPKPGKGPLGDTPRLNAVWQEGVWIKMEWKRVLNGGKKTVIIHWFRNVNTGLDVEFKFKRRK